MSDDKNFEPYIDWSGITDEMTWDLAEKIVPYKQAQDVLVREATRRWRRPKMDKMRMAAVALLNLQAELSALNEAIIRTLVTIPMMVHVAGPKTTEPCDGGGDHEHVVQRCTRCGSVLQTWRDGMMAMAITGPQELEEGDISWWEPGSLVAKSGNSGPGLSLYEIEPAGRELEPHEMICVDLAEMLKT